MFVQSMEARGFATFKDDVFAVGRVLARLLSGNAKLEPADFKPSDLLARCKGSAEEQKMYMNIVQITSQCLDKDAEKRLTAEQLRTKLGPRLSACDMSPLFE